MISIIIDGLTNCLEVRETGEIVATYYRERKEQFTDDEIVNMHKQGWSSNFNWKVVQDEGYQVYELRTKKDDVIQGYIALKHYAADLYTFVSLVESAPWNRSSNGRYMGVGGHLFAIACKESWDNGNEGNVVFESKTDLIEHYTRTLSAKIVNPRIPVKLLLDTRAAANLIQKYFFAEEGFDENDK